MPVVAVYGRIVVVESVWGRYVSCRYERRITGNHPWMEEYAGDMLCVGCLGNEDREECTYVWVGCFELGEFSNAVLYQGFGVGKPDFEVTGCVVELVIEGWVKVGIGADSNGQSGQGGVACSHGADDAVGVLLGDATVV